MPKTVEELEAELTEMKGSLEAVASKNKELLGELKTERKKHRESDVDSDKYYALQDKLDEATEQNKKLTHDLKGRDKDLEKLTGSNTALNANLQSVIIDGGLADNLAKVGVLPQYMDATKALLRSQVTIVDNKAVVGDKPLADFMTEWSGDGGKAFIKAPDSSGGGGQGGQGSGNTDVKKYFDKTGSDFNLTKQAEVFKTDPALYAQLSK